MRLIKLFRWILIPLAVLILIVWALSHVYLCCRPKVDKEQPVFISASECHEDLRKIFLRQIEGAKESIDLIIYSLTDKKLLTALQRRAKEGVLVTIAHDSSSSQRGFGSLRAPIKTYPIEVQGLMHQKILVIDREKVWIGSSNWTTDSLRVDENLTLGLYSPELAKTILAGSFHPHFTLGSQLLEFRTTPEEGKQSLLHLIEKLDEAAVSIRVAMFAFTHPLLLEALLRAQQRGVRVEVVLDSRMARAISAQVKEQLKAAGVETRLYRGGGSFHHKFALIDEKLMINGSANWTRSAFLRNKDCYTILYDLDPKQRAKVRKCWHIIRATSRLAYLSPLAVKSSHED